MNIGRLHTVSSGKKTYALMVIGMAAIAASRFHVIPYFGIAPGDWIPDEFLLVTVMVARSALAKLETAISALTEALTRKP